MSAGLVWWRRSRWTISNYFGTCFCSNKDFNVIVILAIGTASPDCRYKTKWIGTWHVTAAANNSVPARIETTKSETNGKGFGGIA